MVGIWLASVTASECRSVGNPPERVQGLFVKESEGSPPAEIPRPSSWQGWQLSSAFDERNDIWNIGNFI